MKPNLSIPAVEIELLWDTKATAAVNLLLSHVFCDLADFYELLS